MQASELQAAELLLAPEWLLLREGPAQGLGVLVANGEFRDLGPIAELERRYRHLDALRLDGKLLMPGFIDAHHHLTQSFGKSLAFGEPSEIYRRIWMPLEATLDPERVYLAAKLAALEALRGGFTTVCDAGTRAPGGAAAVAAAARDAGLRCVLGLVCSDDLAAAEAHLGRAEALVHPSLAVPVPEAASDETLRRVSRMCAEAGAVFQIHVNEHLEAVERSLVQRGLRPLEHLDRAGALGPHTLVAHATLVTPYELALLRETDTAVSYNPVASQWKGNAVANAQLMSALGIRFGLGTDGTRSDAFRLMDAAEATQRLAFGLQSGDSSCGGGWMWLEHATAAGAHAAGLGQITGEIAPGKAADFLVVDLEVPEMQPSWDLAWELVRLAGREQILAVFVAGRLRLWHGWPLDWDARALMSEAARAARAAVARAPIQRIHRLSGEQRAHVQKRGWLRQAG